MKLIVGLGNPGQEYENTRHNIGFLVIDELAKYYNVKLQKTKFGGLYEIVSVGQEKIILLKPCKYMNISGEVIKNYIKYFSLNVEDILVICDDLNLKLGNFKFKTQSSSGGHNGLKNIEFHLKTKNYKRLKIGISENNLENVRNYVLGNFKKEEKAILNKLLINIPTIINDYLQLSFVLLMNKYNIKNR